MSYVQTQCVGSIDINKPLKYTVNTVLDSYKQIGGYLFKQFKSSKQVFLR